MSDLRDKTISGLKWQIVNSFCSNGIQLIVAIILARLIMPSQFGLIAMLTIFITLMQSLVNGGLNYALIRKQDKTKSDCDTVFYYNITLAIISYIILFFLAPIIASFYNENILIYILRISSIGLIINALTSVHNSLLISELKFKVIAIQNIISTIISGTIAIIMAVNGYEVWALVTQTLIATTINSIILIIYTRWYPHFNFSLISLRSMSSFGSKLMLSELLNSIFTHINSVIIGKIWHSTQLGYYNRANNISQMATITPGNVIDSVTYPALCKINNDDENLQANYRKIIRLSAFIIFPICLGLCSIANPLINVLLTDKWIETVIYLQILLLSYMWYPIHMINLNLLKVKGRSDLFLRLEIIKKAIVIITLGISVPFGIKAMCIGQVFASVIALLINTKYTGLLIKLRTIKQIIDILPSLLLSILMAICCYISVYICGIGITSLAISTIIGISIYFTGAKLLKFNELVELKLILKAQLQSRKS